MNPELLATALQNGKDLVVTSRYRENGDAIPFGAVHALVSRASTLAANGVFPGELRHVDDPMTGYFLIRRSALDIERLRPNRFKILLDIVARAPGLRTTWVPFSVRRDVTPDQQSVVPGRTPLPSPALHPSHRHRVARFSGFGIVGVSGLVIDFLLLAFFTEILGIYYC